MLVKRYYRTRSIDCRGRSAILTQFIFPLRSQNSFLWNQNIRYYHSELNSRLIRKITTFWPSTWKNIRLIPIIKLNIKVDIMIVTCFRVFFEFRSAVNNFVPTFYFVSNLGSLTTRSKAIPSRPLRHIRQGRKSIPSLVLCKLFRLFSYIVQITYNHEPSRARHTFKFHTVWW